MKKIIRTTLLSAFLSLSCLVVVSPVIAEGERTGSADNGMCISKTAEINSDGSYTITLEAYATGSKVITEEKTDVPTDIILVLDQSGSMANTMYTYSFTEYTNKDNDYLYDKRMNDNWDRNLYYKIRDGIYAEVYVDRKWDKGSRDYTYTYYYFDSESVRHTLVTSSGSNTIPKEVFYERKTTGSKKRLQALQDAVTTFSNNVAEKAKGKDGKLGTDDDINHRIAVVGFANYSNYNSYDNTEVFIGATGYKYGKAAKGQYANALQSMNTSDGVSNVTASIGALSADGATYIDLGIEMANGIFEKNPIDSEEKRNRVVVVFTDGVPGYSGEYNDEKYESTGGNAQAVADAAINQVNVTKNTYKATVYTVGIFEGADATSAGNSSGTKTQKANYFMQNLSSNNGTVQNPSYYLSASDSDSLSTIFKQISENIESGGTSVKLNEEAVVKDIISPQFELPEGTTADDIIVETYKCTGKDSNDYTWEKNDDAMGATASINDDQVSVTGFDFAKNYVGTITEGDSKPKYIGNRLVIKFTVKPKEGFLGGNNVFTNVSADIYENSSAKDPVVTFNRPQVNVPIKNITVSDVAKNVYLLNGLTADQLKSGLQVDCGGIPLNLSSEATNYDLQKWQTEYVNIEVKVFDSNNKEINDFDKLTDDTSYYVSVSISPKEKPNEVSIGAEAITRDGKGEGSIFVFTPELTVEDTIAYYGESLSSDLNKRIINVKWKHGDGDSKTYSTSTGIQMEGAEPKLNYDLNPTTGVTDNIISTKNDITVSITAKINTTDITSNTSFMHECRCGYTDCDKPENGEFWIHVKTCNLIISKKGGSDNESYVFKVKKKDGSDYNDYTEVSITGNGTVTIDELPVGEYTVEEDTAWSWRYSEPTITYSDTNQSATLSSTKPTDTASVTNNRKSQNWLNGFSTVVQNIFGKANN